jgi:hypothetical protein
MREYRQREGTMRIAIGIIGLIFMVLVLVQSCAVSFGGAILEEEGLLQGGAAGMLVGILFGVGGAFAFRLPKVSIGIFVVGAVLGLVAGLTTGYSDMVVYGVVSIILSILSFVAHRRMVREEWRSW